MTAGFYRQYAQASTELMMLKKRVSESARQRELLSFELSEIEAAGLKAGEDETLEEQIGLMQNAESIFEALAQAHSGLFGSDDSALSRLGSAMSRLSSVSSYSRELSELSERVSSSYYELEDISSSLRALRDGVSFSPEELDAAEERLEQINALKRKFGGSIEAVLSYAENARKSLLEIDNADGAAAELERKISLFREQYDAAAARLSTLRKDAASMLEKRVGKELSELNFKNAVFSVLMQSTRPQENGTDSVEFLISANLGEELRPLAKVASGGELSRIMLALKRITGDIDGIPTMIFDEIDAGISGETAVLVGEKLSSIAESHQIICITHLPQIAARGEHHYKIEKHSDEISTHTTVVPLSEEERVDEIARMLSGTTVTDAARLAAKELLSQ